MLPGSLVLVGAGKMGGALLDGWLRLGLDPGGVSILDPAPSEHIIAACATRGMHLNPAIEAIKAPTVVVLAIKPQMLNEAAPMIAALLMPATLLLSILAGKTIADLHARLGIARAIVRAMPNTPVAIGRGITGAVANEGVSTSQRAVADTLLSAVGRVEWLASEALIDPLTAVSGSGPAYVFHLAECMAAAGEAMGLPPDLAARLARSTIEGAGELMFRSPDVPVATLRQNVTSPGGTTAAALDVLMSEHGLGRLMRAAIAAATRRAAELSG
ncbi:MAG: pyrroline-5-carboxylate reductase [Methylobacteriaceae bacterium]|nr:pyrroline-5-carboxylate reductase [Methylobacteriaceae bacterium]